jgi:preprotein translocase subunit SecE
VSQTSTGDVSQPRSTGTGRQVIAELRKVVRPTRSELITYTSVSMVFVITVMAFVAALDVGLGKIVVLVFGGA